MTVFAIVNYLDNLKPACDAISELLHIRTRRLPEAETFLGFVIEYESEEPGTAIGSCEGVVIDGMSVDSLASCGVDGIWSLVSLPRESTNRLALIRALLDDSVARGTGFPYRSFVPVFRDDMTRAEFESEMSGLSELCSRSLLPPCYQDRTSGRIVLAPVYTPGAAGAH